MIKAEIVADSLSPQGDRLISVLATFPRIILSEVNTHRMLSKNTSSSRAIPFNKMVEAVQENPFIPIAWQKEHKGMQGSEYFTNEDIIGTLENHWLRARDYAVAQATVLNRSVNYPAREGVTKQLCNRLLEPFMWTTMLITGSKEGWDNFFELRCPSYSISKLIDGDNRVFKSKKDLLKELDYEPIYPDSDLEWLQINKGQGEIHIMDLAEKIYDAMNESTPKQLKSGEWHIPFEDKITDDDLDENLHISENLRGKMPITNDEEQNKYWDRQDLLLNEARVKVSTAMAARTSYTVIGDEKEIDYERMIKLHDKLIEMRHDSPLEHCARAMSDEEYVSFIKGNLDAEIDEDGYVDISTHINNHNSFGWCRNFKGFIQYRHIIENKI